MVLLGGCHGLAIVLRGRLQWHVPMVVTMGVAR